MWRRWSPRAPRRRGCSEQVREVGLGADADLARMERYRPDGTVSVSRRGATGRRARHRHALRVEGMSIAAQVHDAGAPMRVDSFAGAAGAIADGAGARDPVVGRLPGDCSGRISGWSPPPRRRGRFPPETESQIGEFAERVATTIATPRARRADRLTGPHLRRQRRGRRRVGRDLHDGAQQHIVGAVITLKLARRELARRARRSGSCSRRQPTTPRAPPGAASASHGISALGRHPRRAARGRTVAGLEDARCRSASRSCGDRFQPGIEATAYFVVSAALANVGEAVGSAAGQGQGGG